MNIRKRHLVVLIPLALLWLGALGFATMYDLDISRAVADKHSVYGRFFEIAGEPPAILFASFNFALLMAYRLMCTPLTARDKLLTALFALISTGTVFYTCLKTFDYIVKWQNDLGKKLPLEFVFFFLTVLLAIIICVLFIMTALMMGEDRLKKLYSIAKSCAASAVSALVIIWILKLTWGRIRFRGLYGDYSLFTPWYVIRGFTGGFSFPSGHTANASVILSLSYYFKLLPRRFSFIAPVSYALLGIWIAVVAFSRVCVGAHYLSDVLFGAAITFFIVYLARPRSSK